MKQDLNHARCAAALLIAAAALPFTPLLAQDAQTAPAPPPAAQPAPPPAAQAPLDVPPAPIIAPAPAPAPAPVPVPAPTVSVAPPDAATPASRAARPASPARAVTRSAARAPASTAAVARPARAASTAATRAAPASAPAPEPAATAAAPAVAPEPAPLPAATAAPAAHRPAAPRAGSSILPWAVIAVLLLGVVAFVLARRRRRADDVYEERYDEPVAAPVMAAPVAAEDDWGRPWLDLELQPVRAGIEGKEAVVEFALKVDNHGVAPAKDVRVSAFMLQAGASEAERNLIAPKEMPPVEIAPGETKQVETAVALPTDKVQGDAVLPVVRADARYTLPDGSEGRTSASFAVGVPDGEELAHFAVDNPSGLHEDVVARPLGEMEKA